MDTLRKRVPYQSSSEDADSREDRHVLDEQEQEELIEDIRKQTIKTDMQFLRVVQVIVGFSLSLHVLFFFGPNSRNPFFSSSPAKQPIPLVRLLTLLQLFLHFNLWLRLFPNQTWLRDTRLLPMAMNANLALSVAAPVLSLLSSEHWQRTAWWCTTLFASVLVHLRFRWMEEGKQSIAELEKLKYAAKGA